MVNKKHCKLKYCIDDCHVMSCHVMSCRHHCIDSHKNILKTFSSIKNYIKTFGGKFYSLAQFDKQQRLFFVIYKKIINKGGFALCQIKSN